MREILFVGPLPPPVHGFAEINRRMLVRLQQCANVKVFDVTPRKSNGLLASISPWFRLLSLFVNFVGMALRGKGDVLYLPLSGGYRQLIDACFAMVALLCGMRIFVHHHTFSYVNNQPIYVRAVLRLLRGATHVVLCERMGVLLCNRYCISTDRLRVISNAAFLDGIPTHDNATPRNTKLVLGFISNITAAKGCFDFIELVKVAIDKGMAVEGVMAGPVHSEIERAFAEALQSASFVKHVGPVYGEEKYRFFEQIDLLIFPSRDNEAEPVTIWESMESSVPVIALARGCISCIVPSDAGWVIENSSQFVEVGLEHLQCLLDDVSALDCMKAAARSGFEKAKQKYTKNLDDLLLEILGGLKNESEIKL